MGFSRQTPPVAQNVLCSLSTDRSIDRHPNVLIDCDSRPKVPGVPAAVCCLRAFVVVRGERVWRVACRPRAASGKQSAPTDGRNRNCATALIAKIISPFFPLRVRVRVCVAPIKSMRPVDRPIDRSTDPPDPSHHNNHDSQQPAAAGKRARMAEQEEAQQQQQVDLGFKVGEWNELIGEDIEYKVRRY